MSEPFTDATWRECSHCGKKVGAHTECHADVRVLNRSGSSSDRLAKSAEELSKATGRTCIPAKADVREPEQLREAVAKTISKFGRIDFVICGTDFPFYSSGFSPSNRIETQAQLATSYPPFRDCLRMGSKQSSKLIRSVPIHLVRTKLFIW